MPEHLHAQPDNSPALRATMRVACELPPDTSLASDTSPILDFIASDETLDRYGEIILAGGWRLENYRRNPVFQNAHQYGDIIFTLGRALITEIRLVPSTINHSSRRSQAKADQPSTCLYQRVEFATAVNPMARIAYGLYQGKFLNAVSVGFVPLRWEDSPVGSAECGVRSEAGFGTASEDDSGVRRRYLEQELLEVSAVAIPANPGALALAVKAGAVAKTDLKDTLDLLRQITAAASAQPPGRPLENQSLLSLARTIRNLLRRT